MPDNLHRLLYIATAVPLILAIVAVAMLVISGFGAQLDWWDFRTGFVILRYGAYLGLASAILAAVTTVVMLLWHRRRNLIIVNILVVIVSLITVAVPYSWQQQAKSVPAIHDISTDLDNPLKFVDIAPLRADAPNPVAYAGADTARAQREAYPDIQPLYFDAPVEHVFRAAEQAVTELDWELVAVDEDAGFGFKDDVVIRIRYVYAWTCVRSRGSADPMSAPMPRGYEPSWK